jgi:hypothetical protein
VDFPSTFILNEGVKGSTKVVTITNMLDLRKFKHLYKSGEIVQPVELDGTIWGRFVTAYDRVRPLDVPRYVIRELTCHLYEERINQEHVDVFA